MYNNDRSEKNITNETGYCVEATLHHVLTVAFKLRSQIQKNKNKKKKKQKKKKT